MTRDNLLTMLKVLVHRAGGQIDVWQSDLQDINPRSELVLTALPGGDAWVLSLSDAPVQETATMVADVKALPAP